MFKEFYVTSRFDSKKIIRLRKRGHTLKEISEIVGCCWNTAQRWCNSESRAKLAKRQQKYYAKNREKICNKVKTRALKTKDRKSKYNASYRKKNKKKLAKYDHEFYLANKAYRRAISRKYATRKRKSCPLWLTEKQLSQMQRWYEFRENISVMTGVEHHVDHIVPLQGDNVSGLHVPWNLRVIPAIDNLRKNKYYDRKN